MTRHDTKRRRAFNVLAGAATVHGGKFLLLRRSARESFLPNVWGIPAGQIMFDENPEAAALRELQEETGLQGKVLDLIGYSSFTSERDLDLLSNVQLNFLVEAADHRVERKPSHSEHRWISLDDINSNLLDNFTRDIMKSARAYCNGPNSQPA